MEQLRKSDLEKVNKLFNISKGIYNIYQKLKELEKKDQKQTIEYQKNKDYLLMLLDEEQNIYLELYDNRNLIQIFNYINSNYNKCKFSEEYNYIFDIRNNNIIANRILYRLRDIVKTNCINKAELPKCLSSNVIDVFSEDGEYNPYDTMLMENSLFDDIIKTYIYYLSWFYKDDNSDILRDEKFKIVFINRNFENDMFDSNYELVTPELITKYKSKMTSVDYEDFISWGNYLIMENAIANLVFLNEYKILNKNSEVIYKKRISFLSSLLRNLTKEDINYIKTYYIEMLNDKSNNVKENRNIKKLLKQFPVNIPSMRD